MRSFVLYADRQNVALCGKQGFSSKFYAQIKCVIVVFCVPIVGSNKKEILEVQNLQKVGVEYVKLV